MANILAPACAVGVACTFAAPVGGMKRDCSIKAQHLIDTIIIF